MLVDEVETALEPHRIRRLLRSLNNDSTGPVITTTHSRLVLEELTAATLYVVRSDGGQTVVHPVPDDLQPVVRACSEALLARKVVVCEGMTELGLLRALDDHWSKSGESMGLLGIGLANGNGSDAARRVSALLKLGYPVALFADSDRRFEPGIDKLEEAGAAVFVWEGSLALEQRMANDLPWDALCQLVNLAIDEWGEDSVKDAVQARLANGAAIKSASLERWTELVDETDLRTAIGEAAMKAKGGGWFKRADLGEQLGAVVVEHWDAIEETDLRQKLEALRFWMLGNG